MHHNNKRKDMEKVGTLKINGTIVAVDPCYNSNEMKFCGKQIAMPRGSYEVFIQKAEGVVAGVLLIENAMMSHITKAVHPNDSYWCGVDAGCVMLSDKTYYHQTHNELGADNAWYQKEVVEHAYDDYHCTSNNKSVIVSSGHGDGDYPVYELYAGDKLVGCCVKFIGFADDWLEPIKTDLGYILG